MLTLRNPDYENIGCEVETMSIFLLKNCVQSFPYLHNFGLKDTFCLGLKLQLFYSPNAWLIGISLIKNRFAKRLSNKLRY